LWIPEDVDCRLQEGVRHATVAWPKRKLFRKTGTLEKWGWRKELAVTGMRTTRRARVAWCKDNFIRKDCARNQEFEIEEGAMIQHR
jgi:hypothetical protein